MRLTYTHKRMVNEEKGNRHDSERGKEEQGKASKVELQNPNHRGSRQNCKYKIVHAA